MRIVPTVEIELGGQVRHLRFDFEAIYQFKQATGIDIAAGITFTRQEMISVLPELVRACLLHESPELTIRDVRSWIWLGNLDYVLTTIRELIEISTPRNEEGGNSTDAPPLPGSSSGPSPEEPSA